jgi:prepilin-type N-terminal cleavage/methylation domain-containing protein
MADRGIGMKRNISRSGNRDGFTLIEVLIAMFLLVIAIVGLASVTVSVIKSNDLSKMVTTATTRAKDKMEELKNAGKTQAGYDGLANGGDTVETIYVRQWTMGAVGAAAPDNDMTKMKKITVTVTWMWNGKSHTVTLDTIISKPI